MSARGLEKWGLPLLLLSALLWPAPSALGAPAKVLGPNKCTSCHDHEKQAAWAGKDTHAKALAQLEDKNAAKYAKAIGLADPYDLKGSCVGCHATVFNGDANAGVSCETCHGAGSDYVEPHQQKGNHARSLTQGLIDTRGSLQVWAKMCVDCHIMRDPKLIASGHKSGAEFDVGTGSQKIVHWDPPYDFAKLSALGKAGGGGKPAAAAAAPKPETKPAAAAAPAPAAAPAAPAAAPPVKPTTAPAAPPAPAPTAKPAPAPAAAEPPPATAKPAAPPPATAAPAPPATPTAVAVAPAVPAEPAVAAAPSPTPEIPITIEASPVPTRGRPAAAPQPPQRPAEPPAASVAPAAAEAPAPAPSSEKPVKPTPRKAYPKKALTHVTPQPSPPAPTPTPTKRPAPAAPPIRAPH